MDVVGGDRVLTESSAIQLYLAEKYPQAGFIPQNVEDRAQMYRWIFFLVADFNAAYTLDWANEENLLANAPTLRAYLKTMYARPTAPITIHEAFAAQAG